MTAPAAAPRRALVAGGAGFVGSHLVDALVARGAEVVAVDNLCTGRASNLAHLDGHHGFRLVRHDIAEPLADDQIGGPLDAVFNLASPASPSDFTRLSLEILRTGSAGTWHLLDLARDHGARFLQASTSEVYGDPLVHPQPESYLGNVSPIGPRSCYDEAKRFGEALVMAHHRRYATDVGIVRIFNTYGERMRAADGRVLNTFIAQALRGEPLTVFGDGTQTRSFVHVDDEVRGILAVFDSGVTGPVNVGNPVETSMLEVAGRIVRLTGSASEIRLTPMPVEREGDPMQRCPDVTLLRSLTDWDPQVGLDDGLTRLIAWYRATEIALPSAT